MENTQYLIWSEDKLTGVSIIDEQHRCMVSIMNTLYYFNNHDQGEEHLKCMMKMAEQFAISYFAIIEDLMHVSEYEGYSDSVVEHKTILVGIREILSEEATPEDAIHALRYLSRWWRKRMRNDDMKFIAYYKRFMSSTSA